MTVSDAIASNLLLCFCSEYDTEINACYYMSKGLLRIYVLKALCLLFT